MPLFGRYLLKNYLKMLLLSAFAFIAILLVSKVQEIAQFASMGASPSFIARFILHQIPYILPIALPICSLISATLLFQSLSQAHELTALRTGGIPLSHILLPLLIIASLFSIGNFYLTSEVASSSHQATRKMVYDLTSTNPLLLLQNNKMAKLKGAYVQMHPLEKGTSATELVIALIHPKNQRVSLCLAKKLEMKEGELIGKDVSLIGTDSLPLLGFDHLVIDNQKVASSIGTDLAFLLRNKGWSIANDYLKFSMLRIRAASFLQEAVNEVSTEKRERALYNYKKCQSEMIRRLSMGLNFFTFTLMGIAFGIKISRNQSKRAFVIIFILTIFSLISFFIAKSFQHLFLLSMMLFLLPHLILNAASLLTLWRVNRGVE